MNGQAEIIAKIEELKKVFQELDFLTEDFHQATEKIFNNGKGKETYPFDESFEEVAFKVLRWDVKGGK